jgi:hypothetical protein
MKTNHMNNQADNTQRDKTFEFEKRISKLEEENKALREEKKTLRATYQTNDSERLQLLEGIINGTVNTVTMCEAIGDEEGKVIDFRYILFNNTAKGYMGASNEDIHMTGKTLTELFPATLTNGIFERYVDVVDKKATI